MIIQIIIFSDEQETSTTNEPSGEPASDVSMPPASSASNADQDEESMETDVKKEPRSDNMPELDDSEPSTDAATASASSSNVKNEPKDPLAQAMDELTGGSR